MPDSAARVGTRSVLVVEGGSTDRRVEVADGSWLVGRDEACDITVDDHGVSRRHASITKLGDRLWVEDVGSTNGTWVDGERVSGRREISAGQRVQVGGTVLRVDDVRQGAPAPAPHRPGRRVSLVRVAVVGAVAESVLLAAGVLVQLLTDWTGSGEWLAIPLLGTVASLVTLVREAATRPRSPDGGQTAAPSARGGSVDGQPWSSTAPRPGGRRRRQAPVGVGVLVALLVIGGGGLALTHGVATVSSFITGNQTGTERLAEPVTQTEQGVTLTVQSVEQTRSFTRVTVTVRNQLPDTITLPLYKNATLRDADGVTLAADSFRSSWTDTIASGQVSQGTLVFVGRLPDGPTTASLAFATVFEQGFSGPDSIVVDGLGLDALADE